MRDGDGDIGGGWGEGGSAGKDVASRVFTIAPEMPFGDALAAGILARFGHEPGALPSLLVLLPNRRGCRSLAEAFLRQSAGRPLLLPRMSPIGDLDEDELALSGEDTGYEQQLAGNMALPPAIPSLRRQLLLTRLILAIPGKRVAADQAVRLAAELARLLDQVYAEGLDFARLEDLVPDRLAEHWQRTLDFLTLITVHWPRILAEEGCLDPADRRNRLLRAQAEAWRATPPSTPVIAAGSTGTLPATSELLAAITRLPDGAVVLPGLDVDADDATWAALEPTHPQYGMARLLERLGVERRAVKSWPTPVAVPLGPERSRLINSALKPATATGRWGDAPRAWLSALDHVIRIDAPGPEEEARVIALIMREALETKGKTAALATPDRGLARRVAAELARWRVKVDDSGGLPLTQTLPGSYLRLTARLVAEEFAPIPLLAALKHPVAAGGRAPSSFRRAVRLLERKVLRGPRPAPGIAGLRAAVAEWAANRPEAPAQTEELDGQPQTVQEATDKLRRLQRLIADLETCTAPLAAVLSRGYAPLSDLLAAHIETAERLAATNGSSGGSRLWAGEAGEAAAAFVADLRDAADVLPPGPASFYPLLLDALMAGRVVRPRYGRHPRLAIWGLLEARMQRADVMILGSLNEETWPPRVHPSPWMSRPMMTQFGLPVPERRVGLTSHDFTQAFAAPEVVLTRAKRVEGGPTVESRWLMRLANLLHGTDAAARLDGSTPWLEWQRLLDASADPPPAVPPAPRPPVAARPRQLSVTWVEKWMRDPYSVYARFVLGLKALDPLDADPGAADYGSFVHRALDLFAKENPGPLPSDALEGLLSAGRRTIGDKLDRPGVRAFWWPRFERIARWFIEIERERRGVVRSTATEVPGRLDISAPEGAFTLHATADRIDVLPDGTLAIVDYKTGAVPTDKEVAAGFAPQLPLEAAIASAGAFAGVPPRPVAMLEYWRLLGSRPAGRQEPLKQDPRTLAQQALEGFHALVARFDLPETPYPACPRPSAAPRYSDYEHLARVKEWSAIGHGDGA